MLDTIFSAFATWAYSEGKRVLHEFLDLESALTGYSAICSMRLCKLAAIFGPKKVLKDEKLV